MLLAAPAPRGAARLSRAPRAQFGVPLPAPPTTVPPRPSPLFARPPALPRTRDPRLLLGLPPDATPAAAVAALHVLTLVYHPNNSSAHEVRVFRCVFAALQSAAAANAAQPPAPAPRGARRNARGPAALPRCGGGCARGAAVARCAAFASLPGSQLLAPDARTARAGCAAVSGAGGGVRRRVRRPGLVRQPAAGAARHCRACRRRFRRRRLLSHRRRRAAAPPRRRARRACARSGACSPARSLRFAPLLAVAECRAHELSSVLSLPRTAVALCC